MQGKSNRLAWINGNEDSSYENVFISKLRRYWKLEIASKSIEDGFNSYKKFCGLYAYPITKEDTPSQMSKVIPTFLNINLASAILLQIIQLLLDHSDLLMTVQRCKYE